MIVGFQFTSKIPIYRTQDIHDMHEQLIAQTNFKGSWVTAMEKDIVSNISLIYSSRSNNIFTKEIYLRFRIFPCYLLNMNQSKFVRNWEINNIKKK